MIQTRISIVFGALAILMGAFGAHMASHTLSESAYEIFRTAAHYHLLHAIFLFSMVHWRCCTISFILVFLGTCVFSGSLYAYACLAFKPFVYITPLGGLLLIAGWLSLLAGPKAKASI